MQPIKTTRPTKRTSGFTMIELMVVIMIISILSGVVLTAMNNSDGSRALDAGVTKLDSLFSLARSAAISRKQTTRLLISFDDSNLSTPNEPQRMLRYATIVYLDDDGNWKVYTEGEFLPDGIYFSPALSTSSTSPQLQVWDLAIDDSTLDVTQPPNPDPAAVPKTSLSGNEDPLSNPAASNRWYSFEFAPNGTFREPSTRLVLVSGNLQPSGTLIIPTEGTATPADTAKGFVVFRSGKVLHFRDGEQIKDDL